MILNIDQQKVVDSEVNGHMLIRGVAGSGKTTVAVARIPILMEHYCNEGDKVLLLTFNKTLTNYIDYIYDKMDYQYTLFNRLDDRNNLQIKTVDSIVYSLFKELGNKPKVPMRGVKFKVLKYIIEQLKDKYKDIAWYNQSNKEFLLREIEWINSCGYDDIKTYQNADRVGRSAQIKSDGSFGVQRINKNSRQREAIFKTFTFYTYIMNKEKYYDFSDMAKIVAENFDKLETTKYTHVIVDEAQDLTKRQLDVIRLLYDEKEYSSAIFIADTAQSIYPNSWLSYHPFSTIDFNMVGRARVLSKNYRTTKQIAMAAYSLIDGDNNIISNELYVKPTVVDREGGFPVYKNFDNDELEYQYITTRIKSLSKKYDLKDMVVIARNKNQLETAKEYMVNNGVDAKVYKESKVGFDEDAIKLFTMHSIKGLEFKVIFICGLNDEVIPHVSKCTVEDNSNYENQDRKLLYVGMTRAEERLYLTSSGQESKFISDIDRRYLRDSDVEPFEELRKLPQSRFYFSDKLIEKHNPEENIRQAVIHELIETLGYPEVNIDIEVPVSRYSRTGYADIVAYKTNKREKPLLVIETKSPKENIKEHTNQLFDYIQSLPSVRFGMITNGTDHLFYEKIEGKILERRTVPSYENIISTIDKRFLFKNMINNKEFLYIQSGYDNRNISIRYVDEEGVLPVAGYTNINVIGKVSAGLLKTVVQNADYESDIQIPIPNDWLQKGYDYMMLKADGDSMIKAGIDIDTGDYVLVRNQNVVDNYDIAIAVVDDMATMKKVMKMGDNIMLIAENSNYEPICKPSNEVYINGKVVGVLKVG